MGAFARHDPSFSYIDDFVAAARQLASDAGFGASDAGARDDAAASAPPAALSAPGRDAPVTGFFATPAGASARLSAGDPAAPDRDPARSAAPLNLPSGRDALGALLAPVAEPGRPTGSTRAGPGDLAESFGWIAGLAPPPVAAAASAPGAGAVFSVVYGQPPSGTPFNTNGATANQARAALGANGLSVNGAGIKVGVISNSFNGNKYASADLGYGNVLPAASLVHVLQDDIQAGSDDEGRAMMQVVHDIAPGASLDFCTYLGAPKDFANGTQGSDQAFADAILALAADGCKVICDDIVSPDSPWFQSGVVADAIQKIEAQGVTYVSCAGNQRSSATQGGTVQSDPAYQSAWKSTSVTFWTATSGYQTYGDALDFGGGTPYQTLRLAAGASCSLRMQWAQPWGGATSNLALVVSNVVSLGAGLVAQGAAGDYYVFTNAKNPTIAGESVDLKNCPLVDESFGPNDTASIVNDTGVAQTYQISIVNLGGPDPSMVKYLAFTNGGAPGGVSIAGANAGSVEGWHESPYQITVGAADAGNTPAFGHTLPLSEYFSGGGLGSQWLFDSNGNPLSKPYNLFPVIVTGVDDINTSDIVGGKDYGGIGEFFGTSCATPSVAAVAALTLQANGKLNTFDLQDLMYDSAIDMGSPGFDFVTGAGLVQANLAVVYAHGMIAMTAAHANWLGTHLADTFVASAGNHAIFGEGGVDTVDYSGAPNAVVINLASAKGTNGYGGTDTYTGVARLIGSAHNDTLWGGSGSDVLFGGAGNDVLFGAGGNDVLNGGAGNDLLRGGTGNDILTGGPGNDYFVFDSALSATTNVDTITDFSRVAGNTDQIRLDDAIFKALYVAGQPTHALLASQFLAAPTASAHASTASQHVIYDTTTGALYYDADGVGGAAQVRFATLTGHPALSSAMFLVI